MASGSPVLIENVIGLRSTIDYIMARLGGAPGGGVASLNGSNGQISIVAGANVGIAGGASTITISANVPTATNFSLNGTSSSVSISAGPNITIGQAGSTITIQGPSVPAATNFSLNGTSSSVSLVAGNNISLSSGASSITIHAATGGGGVSALSYTQNHLLQQAAPVLVDAITATGAAANAFASSLSLQRIFVPAAMTLSEVQLAWGIAFPATSDGQGSLSQTFAVYSLGNSTSLATLLSASRAVSWDTGSTTSGTASSLQQGWSGNNIQPFTFASSALAPGEYVIGHLVSWAAESTSWTISLFGAIAHSTTTAAGVTAITTATAAAAASFATGSAALTAFTAAPTPANVLSSGGLLGASAYTATVTGLVTAWTATPTAASVLSTLGLNAGSVHTASTSSAVTVFTAAPTAINLLSSAGLGAGSGLTGVSSYAGAFLALSTAGSLTAFTMSAPASAAASSQNTVVSVSVTNTAKSASFQLRGESSNSNIVSSLGTVAGSIHTGSTSTVGIANAGTAGASILSSGGFLAGSFLTASTSAVVLLNAGTAGFAFISSGGLLAGSFLTASTSAAVLANAGTAGVSLANSFTTASFAALTAGAVATAAQTLASAGIPGFGYNGSQAMTTDSTQATYRNGPLSAAIMLTGALPASIDLKSTAVTVNGSAALVQPWFALAA